MIALYKQLLSAKGCAASDSSNSDGSGSMSNRANIS